MKKLIAITVVLSGLSGAAMAQEQQVYNPYTMPPAMIDPAAGQIQEQVYEEQQVGTRRVYPGREIYGRDFGPMPRHPGDYRDAVDRGQWRGGDVGSRSFSIE